jgi:hypothetical protein
MSETEMGQTDRNMKLRNMIPKKELCIMIYG